MEEETCHLCGGGYDLESEWHELTGCKLHIMCFIEWATERPSLVEDFALECFGPDTTSFQLIRGVIDNLDVDAVMREFAERLDPELFTVTRAEEHVYRAMRRVRRRRRQPFWGLAAGRETRFNAHRRTYIARGLINRNKYVDKQLERLRTEKERLEDILGGSALDVFADHCLDYVASTQIARTLLVIFASEASQAPCLSMLEMFPKWNVRGLALHTHEFVLSGLHRRFTDMVRAFANRMYNEFYDVDAEDKLRPSSDGIVDGGTDAMVARIQEKLDEQPLYRMYKEVYRDVHETTATVHILPAFLNFLVGGIRSVYDKAHRPRWAKVLDWLALPPEERAPPPEPELAEVSSERLDELHAFLRNLSDADMLSDDFSVRQLMCPRCRFGPIRKEYCDDMSAHHGLGEGNTDNRCPNCYFFAPHGPDFAGAEGDKWLAWDGLPRRNENDVFPTIKLSSLGDRDIVLHKPPREPCWPYLKSDTPDVDDPRHFLCRSGDRREIVATLLKSYREQPGERPSRKTRRSAR